MKEYIPQIAAAVITSATVTLITNIFGIQAAIIFSLGMTAIVILIIFIIWFSLR